MPVLTVFVAEMLIVFEVPCKVFMLSTYCSCKEKRTEGVFTRLLCETRELFNIHRVTGKRVLFTAVISGILQGPQTT